MPFDEDRVLGTLTLQEKASLTSGADFWHTTAVERAGVPAIMMTDGPHGVRKQVVEGGAAEVGDSAPATCFPPAVTLGCTWDPELMRRVGEALGREAAAQGVAVLLGPGVNIKRTRLEGDFSQIGAQIVSSAACICSMAIFLFFSSLMNIQQNLP